MFVYKLFANSKTCVVYYKLSSHNEMCCLFYKYYINSKTCLVRFTDTPPGTMLLQVTATDVDLNPMLVYDFLPRTGNVGNMFNIDKYNGWIGLSKELNYEQYTGYTLTVRVRLLMDI